MMTWVIAALAAFGLTALMVLIALVLIYWRMFRMVGDMFDDIREGNELPYRNGRSRAHNENAVEQRNRQG